MEWEETSTHTTKRDKDLPNSLSYSFIKLLGTSLDGTILDGPTATVRGHLVTRIKGY